jgi:ABC-type nickel/cobalt efflux system permease component RcnA
MGNFSISHFAGIRVEAGWVELRYILDLAEIPTFQELQATGIVPIPEDPRVAVYLAQKAKALRGGLIVAVNGRPIELEPQSERVIFPSGAGNLPTMKIGVVYRASLQGAVCPCTLDYRDLNYLERAGWKEVVATSAPGLRLVTSTAATSSRSEQLANYPTDLMNSPPQDLSARLVFSLPFAAKREDVARGKLLSSPGDRGGNGEYRTHPQSSARVNPPLGPPRELTASQDVRPQSLALEANKQGTPRSRFTELIATNRWGLWFLLTAALVAAALGGLHALEPGHGKTIVAAYLVGSQGTAAHALLLGLIVTATHTAGVYALGLITLYASKYVVPEQLYPWLGVGSGATIALLGLYMLRHRYASLRHAPGDHHHHGPWRHAQGHGHPHSHNPMDHSGHSHAHQHRVHDHAHGHTHGFERQFSSKQLVTLGVTGGIIPCPAALVVLLSAVSLHRVAFGLYLILAFSFGLAAVLISIGLVTVYARRLLSHLPSDGSLINRWLPMASASAITCLGLGILIQALMTAGVFHARLVISWL